MRFAFDWNAVDTDELIAGPQAAVFLGSAQRYDGTDVDLKTRLQVTRDLDTHTAREIDPIILSNKNTGILYIAIHSQSTLNN